MPLQMQVYKIKIKEATDVNVHDGINFLKLPLDRIIKKLSF